VTVIHRLVELLYDPSTCSCPEILLVLLANKCIAC